MLLCFVLVEDHQMVIVGDLKQSTMGQLFISVSSTHVGNGRQISHFSASSLLMLN